MRATRTGRMTVIGSIVALAFGASAAAEAKPLERERYHDVGTSEPYQLCGLTVQDAFDLRGQTAVNSHGRDGLPYFMETAHISITTTNLANGRPFTQVGNFVDKDLRVTDNGDGTLTILIMGSGGDRIYGPDGKIVARNPGQTRSEILVDHGGTPSDPSDDEFLEFLGVVKGSTGRNDPFGCEQILELIG